MKLIPSNLLRSTGRRRFLPVFAGILTAAVLSSCGNSKAKQTVRTFLDQSLAHTEYDIQSFSEVDSTERVTPATVRQMRQFTASHFQPKVNYVAPTTKLRYVRVVYTQDKDTIRQTFYMNDAMTGVVCVKNDNK